MKPKLTSAVLEFFAIFASYFAFRHLVLSTTLVAFIAFGVPTAALADPLTYTAINIGSLGGRGTMGYAINSAEQITGFSSTAVGNVDAFLYTPGIGMADIGASLGADVSVGWSINAAGQVAGYYHTTTGIEPFVYSPATGAVAITSPLFGNYALSYGINESGEIIGFTIQNAFIYTTASGASYIPSAVDAVSVNDNGQVTGGLANGDAYLYTPGIGVTDLGTVGGKSAYGVAINSNGDIVGNVQNLSNNQVAFLYNGGVTDLGTLGGGQSYAEGINESDEVVGQAWTTGDASADAFLYTNGTMYDLNSLTGGLPNGTTLQNAYGINNTGWIIANGNDDATYLLEPDIAVPEPRSLALVNSGVAIFVVLLFVADRVRSMRSWLPRFAVVFPLRDFVGVGVWFYVATLILRGKLFNPINNQHFDRRSLWNEF